MQREYTKTPKNDNLKCGDRVFLPNNIPAIIKGWYSDDEQPYFVVDRQSNDDFLKYMDFHQPLRDTLIKKCSSNVANYKGGKELNHFNFLIQPTDPKFPRKINDQQEIQKQQMDALQCKSRKCYITRPLLTLIEDSETITDNDKQYLLKHFTRKNGKIIFPKTNLPGIRSYLNINKCSNAPLACQCDNDITSQDYYYECKCHQTDQIKYCAACFDFYISRQDQQETTKKNSNYRK